MQQKQIRNTCFNVFKSKMKEKIAIYPGSFDPPTKGHLHIIEKASKIFDKIIVVIANNSKKKPMFTLQQRTEMLRRSISIPNIQIMISDKLTVDFANDNDALYIIRGIRNTTDFEYEQTLNSINKKIKSDIETIFLMPDKEYETMSSSVAKELLNYNSNVDWIIPDEVIKYINNKEDK